MNGDGFKVLVKAGDKVQAGTPLLEFDITLIQKNGYATDCILLLANSDRFPNVTFLAGMDANQNETVICHF